MNYEKTELFQIIDLFIKRRSHFLKTFPIRCLLQLFDSIWRHLLCCEIKIGPFRSPYFVQVCHRRIKFAVTSVTIPVLLLFWQQTFVQTQLRRLHFWNLRNLFEDLFALICVNIGWSRSIKAIKDWGAVVLVNHESRVLEDLFVKVFWTDNSSNVCLLKTLHDRVKFAVLPLIFRIKWRHFGITLMYFRPQRDNFKIEILSRNATHTLLSLLLRCDDALGFCHHRCWALLFMLHFSTWSLRLHFMSLLFGVVFRRSLIKHVTTFIWWRSFAYVNSLHIWGLDLLLGRNFLEFCRHWHIYVAQFKDWDRVLVILSNLSFGLIFLNVFWAMIWHLKGRIKLFIFVLNRFILGKIRGCMLINVLIFKDLVKSYWWSLTYNFFLLVSLALICVCLDLNFLRDWLRNWRLICGQAPIVNS